MSSVCLCREALNYKKKFPTKINLNVNNNEILSGGKSIYTILLQKGKSEKKKPNPLFSVLFLFLLLVKNFRKVENPPPPPWTKFLDPRLQIIISQLCHRIVKVIPYIIYLLNMFGPERYFVSPMCFWRRRTIKLSVSSSYEVSLFEFGYL